MTRVFTSQGDIPYDPYEMPLDPQANQSSEKLATEEVSVEQEIDATPSPKKLVDLPPESINDEIMQEISHDDDLKLVGSNLSLFGSQFTSTEETFKRLDLQKSLADAAKIMVEQGKLEQAMKIYKLIEDLNK